MTYLAVQVGAAGGSAHGGASPPAYSAGSGCPPGLSARVPPGRLLSDLMLRLLASLSPFVALRFLPLPCVRFSPLRSSSLSRGVSPPFAFSASFPFLPLPFVQFSPVLSTVRYRFLHGSLRPCSLVFPSASFPFLPLPCVRFSPVLSTSFLTPLPGSFSSPFHAYLLGIVPLPRFWFSPLPVRFRFSSASSPLPPVSFPFLPLPFVQFSPVLSTLVRFVLPPSSRPLGVPTLPPFSFRIPGSAAPLSGLGFCGPRVAPKRPHTTPQERQEQQGRFGHLNLTLSSRRSPAVHWKPRSESVSF